MTSKKEQHIGEVRTMNDGSVAEIIEYFSAAKQKRRINDERLLRCQFKDPV